MTIINEVTYNLLLYINISMIEKMNVFFEKISIFFLEKFSDNRCYEVYEVISYFSNKIRLLGL